MSRIVRLTESDLTRIVRRVISEQGRTYFVDGQNWTWVGTDTQSYGGKKASIELKHVPTKGGTALPNKTWLVGCDTSFNPKPRSEADKKVLTSLALQSLSC